MIADLFSFAVSFQALMVVVGHHIKSQSEVSSIPLESPTSKATHWSIREKIKHFEVNAYDRSTLYEMFIYIASKLNPVQNKSTFPQLSMVRKSTKSEN